MTTIPAARDQVESASLSSTLMTRWRVARRASAFGVWTLAIGSASILGATLLLPAPRLRKRWQAGCCRVWGRLTCPLIGVRLTVRGTPPRAPYLLVSNHLGYLDVITLGSQLRGVFVSKADVASWPVMGAIARGAGTIFVERGKRMDVKRVNAAIDGTLDLGVGATLFPEGTSSSGAEVLPFRASLLEPAASIQRPVHYASIHYATPAGSPPASTHVAWWGEMTFGPHFLALLALPSIQATITFGETPIVDADRRQLAARLHGAITDIFEPLAHQEAA